MLVFTLTSTAADVFSQRAKISISIHNTKLTDAFKKIQEKSNFYFYYKENEVDQRIRVNLNARGQSIESILDHILSNTNLGYKIVDQYIIINTHRVKAKPEITQVVKQEAKPIVILPPAPPVKEKVTGLVTDKTGVSMPGVTVSVKGTNNGTVTDADGRYSLSDIPPNATLVFSFIGTKKREVKVNGHSVINTIMETEGTGLEEVVVVAYGSQKKVAVTGAINTVGSNELMQSSSASLAGALAGRLSGLTSLETGGDQPGVDDATLYLRGAATLNGKNPLVLIDGVERDNIRTLDANEVESVSVLKDASATAVFGVRGANGVILITTKRGVEGKAQLNLNAEQSFTTFTREPTFLHSVDYMNLRNEASLNDGLTTPFSDAVIAKYKNPLAGLDPTSADYASQAKIRKYMYCDNDYYRKYIRRYTPQTRINLNISGGTQKVKYFVDAGYLHQGGNLNTESKSQLGYDPAAKMDRFSFRSNLDYQITKSLSALINLGSYIEQVNMPNADIYGGDTGWMMGDLFYQAKSVLPITPGPTTIAGFGVAAGKAIDPTYLDRSAFEIMNRRGYCNYVRSNLNSSLGLTWDLSQAVTPGLNIKGMVSFDSQANTETTGSKAELLYSANVNYNTDELTYSQIGGIAEKLLSLSKTESSNYRINLQGSINYNRKFGKHEVSGMILGQRDNWEIASGISSALIPYNLLGIASRISYNYDNRYFAEYDMGYNGSEQFNPKHRFGYFPAVSAGWVLTNEEFLKDNPVLTNLKIRGSWGKVGNDSQSSSRFIYLDNNTVVSGGLNSLGGTTSTKGKYISQGLLGNQDLTWEIADKKNIGIDFQILKNLSGSFDFFKEHRSQVLLNRWSLPTLQGVFLSNIPLMNIGVVNNHGYEAELTYNKSISKDLSFMIKGNYSYNHNKVINADQVYRGSSYAVTYPTNTSGSATYTTGYSIGQNFGYEIDWKDHGGYWTSAEEIKNSGLTYAFGTPRVGDFKYVDVNKDGVIDEKDKVAIGYSAIPRINYGITLGVNYCAFDFTIFFQGVSKYSRDYTLSSSGNGYGIYETIKQGTYYDYHCNAWTLERYVKGEKITYPALSTQANTNQESNDFFIMNCSYIRLRNLELGYTLPKNALKAIGISKLRITIGGQNLCLWDHLRIGNIDPEQTNPNGYPINKMVNFGLNVTF